MAEITNPQAIRFANEHIRPVAERLAGAYYHAKQAVDAYWAENMAAHFISGEGPVVDTQHPWDDRPSMDADDVLNLLTRIGELVADYEANSKAKLNTILACSANPR